MPLPRAVARFDRGVTNRVLRPAARYLPGFDVVVHRSRKTGRLYRTPVNVFPRPGGFFIALTYGPDSDWVRNVLAAGGCRLETRGRTLHLTRPRLGPRRAEARPAGAAAAGRCAGPCLRLPHTRSRRSRVAGGLRQRAAPAGSRQARWCRRGRLPRRRYPNEPVAKADRSAPTGAIATARRASRPADGTTPAERHRTHAAGAGPLLRPGAQAGPSTMGAARCCALTRTPLRAE